MENTQNNTPNQSVNQPQPLNKNLAMICGTIIVACLIIAGAILYSNFSGKNNNTVTNGNAPSQQQQPATTAADINKVNIAGNPFIGDKNAPIIVAEWLDYQCPFCKRLNDQVMPQLMKEYVDAGKVKIVFKDYQFLGSDSQTAGLAGRAVWETAPNKFYEWHKAMFEKQDNENGGWGTKADILALAQSLGIDSNKVGQLMTSKAAEYQKTIDADKTEGTSFGINGTPGTIIGKQLISGAQPYSAFKIIIDEQLKSLGK